LEKSGGPGKSRSMDRATQSFFLSNPHDVFAVT